MGFIFTISQKRYTNSMIESVTQLEPKDFSDPYHDIMARSLVTRPREATRFFLDRERGTPAVYDPDLGFSYDNRSQNDLKKWAQWLFDERIPLIAGELQSHYRLLQTMGEILPTDGSVQAFCRYEFQDFCTFQGEISSPSLQGLRIKQATAAETTKLFAFYEKSETMKAKSKKSLQYTIENNKLFYLQKTGKIVSAVLTHCENSDAALIGGVYTPEKHRGKGYARICMEALMDTLKKEGKTPCLFYEKNNASAKRLYQKLGFQPYGDWVVIEMTYEEASAKTS